MPLAADDLDATRSETAVFVSSLVVYLVLGVIGQNLVFEGTTVSPLWPAAGVALGLGWRVHRRGLVSARSVALSVALGQFVVFWLGPSIKALLVHGAT